MAPIAFLLFLSSSALRLQSHPNWDGGDNALYYHAGDFDVTIGEFQYRTGIEVRHAVIHTGNPGKGDIPVAIDQFKVIDSTARSADDTLNAVTPLAFDRDKSLTDLVPGKRYLLITCPQEKGELVELGGASDTANLVFTKRTVRATYASSDPKEEICKVALQTEARRLHGAGDPASTLAMSAYDCLDTKDTTAFVRAFTFLQEGGDPDPSIDLTLPVHPPIYPESPTSLLLRAEAAKKTTPLIRQIAIYELLNSWRLDNTARNLMAELVLGAHDPGACPEGVGSITLNRDEVGAYPPLADQTMAALDHATNEPIIIFFLQAQVLLTKEQDAKLAVYLDSPALFVRYTAAEHFARSRNRPDLAPTQTRDSRTYETTYPDLDEKVAAWKAYFGTS